LELYKILLLCPAQIINQPFFELHFLIAIILLKGNKIYKGSAQEKLNNNDARYRKYIILSET
jgi:hypothetical protein